MSFTIKAATTAPVRIDVDLDTNEGRLQGFFTGHAHIRSKADLTGFAEEMKRLDNWVRAARGDDAADAVSDADRKNFSDITPANADEMMLRRLYDRFDGLAAEGKALTGDEAIREICYGPLSVTLFRAATERYWQWFNGEQSETRAGNARPSRGR